MCGFVGYLTFANKDNYSIISQTLREMSDAITHRGPDDSGYWLDVDSGIALAHRRLSIVDLSFAAAQPMVSASGRFVLAFNGEIYNYSDLRSQIQSISHSKVWRGHSDTEVLLAGFDVWGISATIKKCVGMFSMAIWCRQTHCLSLIRDRFGEKPLYYGWQGRGSNSIFLFGSELKALRVHPMFTSDIDIDALGVFMQNMVVDGSRTIYKNIYKLLPGTILNLSLNRPFPKLEKYWSVENAISQGIADRFTGSKVEAVDQLQLLLSQAVSQQMMADVPLGAFLSGGVDSSAIVALMQSQSSRAIKTFSIGFDEINYNEAGYAKAIASHLGTDHTELYITGRQAMEVIPRLPHLYDEPFADSSQIPTFLLSQMTSQHVKVALTGDGGDELFGGYTRYELTARLWPWLVRMPQSMRNLASWALRQLPVDTLNHWADKTRFSKEWINIGDKLHRGAGIMNAASIPELYRGLLAMGWQKPEELVKGFGADTNSLYLPSFSDLGGVEQLMAYDLLNYLPDDILTKVDRAAMGVSLETRVPFLDHRIAEFVFRLPIDYKLSQHKNKIQTKWILRQLLNRYVPHKLIERPKAGFGIPLEHWLRGPLREWAEDLLGEDRIKRDGFLNYIPVRQRWHEHLRGKRNWQHSIWCILMFNSWLDEQKRVAISK